MLPCELVYIIWEYIDPICKYKLNKNYYNIFYNKTNVDYVYNYLYIKFLIINNCNFFLKNIFDNYDYNFFKEKKFYFDSLTFFNKIDFLLFVSKKYNNFDAFHILSNYYNKYANNKKEKKIYKVSSNKHILWTN